MKTATKRARRALPVLLAAVLLAACGGDGAKGMGTAVSAPPPAQSTAQATPAPAGAPPQLTVIRNDFEMFACGPDGFYMSQYPQGDTLQNMMVYDFEALEQRYFCDVPGCTHDAPGCTSYDLGSGNVFPYGGYLYVNYSAWRGGSDSEDPNDWPSALVRYDMDGKNPYVLLESAPYEMQIQTLLCDGEAFYFAYSDMFIRLDLETGEITDRYPLAFYTTAGDSTSLYLLGSVYNNQALFLRDHADYSTGTDAGGALELCSFDVYTGQETFLHSFDRERYWPGRFGPDGKGYFVEQKTGEILCFDLATGQETLVTDAFCHLADAQDWGNRTHYLASMWMVEAYDDWLIVNIYLRDERDGYIPVTYAYNLQTGENREIDFGNYFNGGLHHMYIHGQTPYGLLVIEEYRPRTLATTGTDGVPYTLDTSQEIYGLIDLEDFVAGRPNFRTLAPVAYTGMAA